MRTMRRGASSASLASLFPLSLFPLLLLLLLLLACTAPAAAAAATPPPPSPTTLELASLEAPAPPPSAAARGKRYLVSTLSVGPSHAFVIARVARELVARGGSVTLLCSSAMRPHFDVPPPGVRARSIDVGRGEARDEAGALGAIPGEVSREPTEADFADDDVQWTTVHYNTSGELMRRLPELMKISRGKYVLPWQNFHLFAAGLAAECDELVANERLLKAVRLSRPDVFVGDLMEACFPVLGERAFREGGERGEDSSVVRPPPPPPPRVAFHNGPVITPMFDTAGFDLLGRDWGIPAQLASVPTFGTGLVPPFSLLQRSLNLANYLGSSGHDFFRMRPIVQGLHKRHGVPFRGDGRSSEQQIRAARQRDALLVFQGDWAIDWPRPMPPATLVAGPVMPGPAKALPADLAAWIEGAKAAGEKVVYAALGATFVLSPESSKDIVRALDRAAPEARILIKLSERDLPAEAERELREELNSAGTGTGTGTGGEPPQRRRRGPERLRVARWAPQNDLLGTPGAVALYVTHGGISSLSEAAYHGVPVVALPQGAEQPDNAAKVEHRGLGVGLRRGASPGELAAAVSRVLADEGGGFARAARAAAVRMRAGRAPAAAVVAAAIERVAVASGAFEEVGSSPSSASSSSTPPLLPDPGWRMPSSDLPWVARHCLDAGVVLLAVAVGVPLLLLRGLWFAVSRASLSMTRSGGTKAFASSSGTSRPRRASSSGASAAAAEHIKLS